MTTKPSKSKASGKGKKAPKSRARPKGQQTMRVPSHNALMKSSADSAAHGAIMEHPQVKRMRGQMSKAILSAMKSGPRGMRASTK